MNPFVLFENKNIEDIKLGLQVVNSLGYQKEFEKHFNISYHNYNKIFNNIVLVLEKDSELEYECDNILTDNLNLSKLGSLTIYWILKHQPTLIDYFDTNKLNEDDISLLLEHQPQLKKHPKIKKIIMEQKEFLF